MVAVHSGGGKVACPAQGRTRAEEVGGVVRENRVEVHVGDRRDACEDVGGATKPLKRRAAQGHVLVVVRCEYVCVDKTTVAATVIGGNDVTDIFSCESKGRLSTLTPQPYPRCGMCRILCILHRPIADAQRQQVQARRNQHRI